MLRSPKGTYDNNFLSNYAAINVNDNIARIQGVGQINLFGGSDYAMRVWLRPDRIAKLGITDLSGYACVPGATPPPMRLDDPNGYWQRGGG